MAKRVDDFPFDRGGLSPEEFEAVLQGDFASFAQAMFATITGSELMWDPYLDLICSRLQDVAHGSRRNLMINVPPRHLKSFLVSVALPAYVLGLYPDQDIMCVSYGAELAKEFAGGTQRIMRSGLYRKVFGSVLARARQPLHTLRARRGGIRRATSVDGAATGVGADLLIFDDPQKAGGALSDVIRRSTNSAYEQTFLGRRNLPMTARTVIVMQRLHEDDFCGHVLELDSDWEVLRLPAIAEEDESVPYETFLGPRVYRRREGEALHPGRVPCAELDRIRRASGEAVWASQYQQRPAPAGGGLIKLNWFRRYTDADLPETFDRIVQSWDTANTAEEWSAYSVCTTWGVKGKHAYLLHVLRARLDFPQLKCAVLQQAQLHDATVVFIEAHASGVQIIQQLRAENFGKLRPIKPVGDKATRMINQSAYIENGFVHLPADAPWLADYLHEFAMFPKPKFFDQIDATSQALEGINAWTENAGLLELARQDLEARAAQAEEIWIMSGPSGTLEDGKGVIHRRQPDGYFHLKREHALTLINQIGWKRVG